MQGLYNTLKKPKEEHLHVVGSYPYLCCQLADLGAAFLFSVTTLAAAAPVLAAAESIQAVKPSAVPTITTPTVPPAAVDSAVNQIIAVVKVTPVNVV